MLDSSDPLSLRPATEDDLLQIVEIDQRSSPLPWGMESFRSELFKSHSFFWVMTDDETDSVIVGYIIFWHLFDVCHVMNLAIDEPYRKKGLGRKMISKVAELAARKSAGKIVLEVRKSNAPAIQFYQSLNFYIIQVKKKFYSNGEDAYCMECLISTPVLE